MTAISSVSARHTRMSRYALGKWSRALPGRPVSLLYLRCASSASASKSSPHEEALVDARPFSEIPGPKPSIPLIGTAWQYFPSAGRYSLFKLHEANMDKYRRYGDILKEEYQWQKPVVQLYNPNDFETVFRHQGTYPLRPITDFLVHYRSNNPHKYDGPGIANATGKEWKRLRDALAPLMLRTPLFYDHMDRHNDIYNDFVHLLKESRDDSTKCIDNLRDFAYRLALESICMLCFDSRLGCLDPKISPKSDGSVMISAVRKLFEAFQELYYGLPLWKYMKTPSYQKLHDSESAIYKTATHYLQEFLKRPKEISVPRGSSGPRTPTFLEAMLQNKDLSHKEKELVIVDFIAGGIFTVSNTLCFLLYHLARNPDVQEKLYQEIVTVTSPRAGFVGPDALSKLVYLKACIKETFRLTPTVPGIMRILPEDVVLSGYHVPAGVVICCHFMVTCHLEKYFPEPHAFRPERWIGANRHSIHPFCLLPFGHGTRMCLGRRFTEMELCLAVAKVVHNFKLESKSGDIELAHPFIVVPASPIAIQFTDRNS